jgi:hypothetical protein
MAKKIKKRAAKRAHHQRASRRLSTWTRDSNTPFSGTEYPFEQAVAVGEYSELLQRDMGPGLILYPSTICLSRQDTRDATVLALLGEHFREFFSDEMPWLSKSTAQMCSAMMINAQDEEEVEELDDTLRYFADQGYLDLDLSNPGVYRYRLNVDAVRRAKNACFKPMNGLEQIIQAYPQRFPDTDMQELAFALICDRDRYMTSIMMTMWHLSLRETPWMARHVDGRLRWMREDMFLEYLPVALSDQAKAKLALAQLVKKGLVQVRQQGQLREYRPNVSQMWDELERLPEALPDLAELGEYRDDEGGQPGPEE